MNVREEILERLRSAEIEHDVRMLYACESGSRAWGFASPDSDYDVRFIYVRPQEWYLSFNVERRRDVIEYPIVDLIDCNGWDLRKALFLFSRTNGVLFEWLHSPIRYLDEGETAQRLRGLGAEAANDVALCYHYSHMARRNASEYIFKERVRLKKYFYVLRPLLAIRYIEAGCGIPPVEFERLVEAVAPNEIHEDIAELLERKRNAPELGLGDPIPPISRFIARELERHGDVFSGQGRPDILSKQEILDELNDIFRRALKERQQEADVSQVAGQR